MRTVPGHLRGRDYSRAHSPRREGPLPGPQPRSCPGERDMAPGPRPVVRTVWPGFGFGASRSQTEVLPAPSGEPLGPRW